jgi:hypothetical protein
MPKSDKSSRSTRSTSKRPLKAFLCHSKRDKAAVRRLNAKLSKDSVKTWFDEKDLLPGQDWTLMIQVAVQDCDVVLICLSRAAIDNRGYIHKEIQLALDIAQLQPEGSIFIVPVRLEECDIPQRLQKYHWSNLFQRGGYAKLLSSLKERANELGKDL